MRCNHLARRAAHGFSLIELVVVMAIIAVIAAVAIPVYGDHVKSSRLTEAFSGLATVQSAAEDFWNSHHTYAGMDLDTPSRLPPNGDNFTFTLSAASDSAYTVTATGTGSVAGFVFTIDQNGKRATTASPAGWGTNAGCWVDHKAGKCVQ